MNPLSIELYKRYKKDITREPLAFAVNNQHMNGGVAVDIWGRSSLEGCYAIGEAAGTHGVTRPGGAALNAGQVFGLRCAQHIAARKREPSIDAPPMRRARGRDRFSDRRSAQRGWDRLARDRTRSAGAHERSCRLHLLRRGRARRIVGSAQTEREDSRARASAWAGADQAARALQWRQTALVSEAVLAALDAYLSEGGGSRGARAICDPEGADVPVTRLGPLEPFRFRAERAEDRARKIFVRLDGEGFVCNSRPIRRRDRTKAAYFERDWARFLSGAIFERRPMIPDASWRKRLHRPLPLSQGE